MMRTSRLKAGRGFIIDRRPLGVDAFRRLWVASVVCAVGGSFSLAAIPTQLFTMTGSSAAVGASAVVSFVALMVSALWAGALADVRDRRTILLAAHCGLALTYAALWTQSVLDARSVPILMMLVACQGLTFGSIMTTMGAVVPRLVPVELLPAANSLSSLVRYAGSIVGPVLAGLLIPLVGLGTLYLFDALALLAVVWAVAELPRLESARASNVPAEPHRGDHRTIAQILAGFRYLAASRLLVAVLAVDLSAMVFGMPIALYPEVAQRTYGGPAGGGPALGLLYAAYPAGVFAVGLLSGTFTRARRHGALMAAAAAAWGITVVVLGLAAQLWIALIALVLGGAANFVLSTFRNAISQALTDDAMRGRIQGSLTVVLIGGPQLANLLHGTTASLLGPRTVICIGGLLTTMAVAAIAWRVPELCSYTMSSPEPRREPDRSA
ncbi:MFS family permease [Nonomuraea muscovyensis]|uniref:MFS family permease n=1 Tax=Nonomuraea muscovyensis TaxID=1124761 RepID=A0A7X0C5K6_9ACTN|nr:MFS transporter [Nonomuraea muscovyensis]MBB6347516.1 MFS family permease [Nonomuraea muscovyensis]